MIRGFVSIVYTSVLLIYFKPINALNISQFGEVSGSNLNHKIFGSQANSISRISQPGIRHYYEQNNFDTKYQNVQMFQPINHFDYYSELSNVFETANVMVKIQLTDYVDQGLRLPKGQTCICPSQFPCSYLGTSVPRCYMSFTVILISPDESVKYFSTEFVSLTSSGNVDIDSMSPQQKQTWQQPHTFYLTSKPSAIDVFVHHMGAVIDAQTGQLTNVQTVVHVDTFVLPLHSVIPSIANGHLPMQSRNLDGVILQTQLTIAYSVQCKGTLIGRDCDLICDKAVENTAKAICHSNKTNFFYTCTYMESGQVQNCLPCPWGITQESYCQDSSGGILASSAEDLVSYKFKITTIILGILVVILLILLILTITFLLLKMGKKMRWSIHSNNSTTSGHNYLAKLRSEGNSNRPLLQSINDQQRCAPTAAPRSVPRNDALPIRSSLRKTILLPQPESRSVPSINDTLNSTHSSMLLPSSKEADV